MSNFENHYNQILEKKNESEYQTEAALAQLSIDVSTVIRDILYNTDIFREIKYKDSALAITVDNCSAFSQTLYLNNAQGFPAEMPGNDCIIYAIGLRYADSNGYRLFGEICCFSWDGDNEY